MTDNEKKEQPFDYEKLRREMELYHSVGFCEGAVKALLSRVEHLEERISRLESRRKKSS